MTYFSRRNKIIMGIAAVIVGGYIVTNFLNGSAGSISADFSDARTQGALIAQAIVDLSNEAVADLQTISKLDSEARFREALDLTSQVVLKSRDIRSRAAELSTQIEKMTLSLSSIHSVQAQAAVLESISSRLALISRLINYSAALGELLETLGNRFKGDPVGRDEVSALVSQINAEVTAINSFNEQAGRAMERFDGIIGR